jgi:hypothetical protein
MSDRLWRNVCWMAVEHKTDFPHPTNPLSQRKDLSWVNHMVKREPLTNQVPVPRCRLAHAALWLIVASGALSQSRIVEEIWVALTTSRSDLSSVILSWIFLWSLSCSTSSASDKLWRTVLPQRSKNEELFPNINPILNLISFEHPNASRNCPFKP